MTSDGVKLGYQRAGSGPPLLLVHGGCTDHRSYDPIFGLLAERFTVTAYDRRGLGMSADGTGYSLDREADDVVEAAQHAGDGEPVAVLGYSYGGLVAIHAVTTRPAPVRALVAYEAPYGVPGMIPALDEMVTLVAAGRHDDAIRLFISTTFLLSDNAINAMTKHPMWQVTLAAVPLLPRECAEVVRSRLEPPTVPVPPVRYLVGAEGGSPAFRQVADLVKRTIPGADVHTVPGLPHFAVATEPNAFVAKVVEFLNR